MEPATPYIPLQVQLPPPQVLKAPAQMTIRQSQVMTCTLVVLEMKD